MKSKRTLARKAQEKKRKVGHLRAMHSALASALRISVDPNVHSFTRKKAKKAIPYYKDQIAKSEKINSSLNQNKDE